MRSIYLAALLLMIACGCGRPVAKNKNTRELFDAAGMKVITAFANRIDRTMSILYGNDAAMKAALSGNQEKIPEEQFTLVTYYQADNKYWYGSYINGRIKSVETITIEQAPDSGNVFVYNLEDGVRPKTALGATISEADRISEILAHKASVFP